jgi:hydroxylaminobenzene mutase
MLVAAASWITKAGSVELAVGALLGWVVWMALDTRWLKKIGVRSPRRILQAHLDLIIMGILLIAVGTAGPDFPSPWSVILVIGAWTNALLFLPAAWYDTKPKDLKANLAQTVSFTLVSVGTVAFAVYLLTTG